MFWILKCLHSQSHLQTRLDFALPFPDRNRKQLQRQNNTKQRQNTREEATGHRQQRENKLKRTRSSSSVPACAYFGLSCHC